METRIKMRAPKCLTTIFDKDLPAIFSQIELKPDRFKYVIKRKVSIRGTWN